MRPGKVLNHYSIAVDGCVNETSSKFDEKYDANDCKYWYFGAAKTDFNSNAMCVACEPGYILAPFTVSKDTCLQIIDTRTMEPNQFCSSLDRYNYSNTNLG